MSSSLEVRAVEPGDVEQWRQLWDGYNNFYGRVGAKALSPEVIETTWNRFLDGAEPVHALVAVENGRLLGMTHYLFHRTTVAIEPTCYLQDLFVREDARGSGVGRALIQGVYNRARDVGAPRVYWLTHESNLTAMALYDDVAERPGFLLYYKLFR